MRYAHSMAPKLLDQPTSDPPVLNLYVEITAAREVLEGLMDLWRRQEPLTIESARHLSVLVFNGTRAVVWLLFHQTRLKQFNPETDWIDEMIDKLSEEKEWDLLR